LNSEKYYNPNIILTFQRFLIFLVFLFSGENSMTKEEFQKMKQELEA